MSKKTWLMIALVAIAAAIVVWGVTQTLANFGKDPSRILPVPSTPAASAPPAPGGRAAR